MSLEQPKQNGGTMATVDADIAATPPPRSRALRRQPLSDAVAEAIADGIASGQLTPGDRVIETVIADTLHVSRVPVREALKVLSAQGILIGGAHRGYRVVSFNSERVRDVLEIRVALETILLRDALAGWRETGDFDEIDATLDAMRFAAARQDVSGVLKADLAFHRAICRAAGNETAQTLWEAIARHVLIIFGLERRRQEDLGKVVRQHEEFRAFIDKALAKVKPKAIRRAVEDHILVVMRSKEKDALRS